MDPARPEHATGDVSGDLVEAGYPGRIGQVTNADSYIPLGPAADTDLLGEPEITAAALALLDDASA